MEEDIFVLSMKKYDSFKKQLINSNNLQSFNCYLIDESWYNKLLDNFYLYKKLQLKFGIFSFNKMINFPNREPYFINDLSKLTEFLNKNQQFNIISKEVMEVIYRKDYLNNFKHFKYYVKNNKSIIDFENEKVALLLFNNFKNGIKFEKNKFIILPNNENKIDLYKKALSNELDINNEINENIISFEEYIESIKYHINDVENIKNNFNKEIIKLFISIFYYEKFLSENSENLFTDKYEHYFLINQQYLAKLKECFNYEKNYEDKLKNIDGNINYINYEKYLEKISEVIADENDLQNKKNVFI